MMLFMHLFQRDYHGLFEPLVFLWGQPLSYYFALFSDACVPIFCFVSGYGLYFKYQNRSQMYVKSNIIRIIRLYINYWIILLLFAVGLGLYLGKTEYIGGFQKFALNFLALDTSYNGAWWFFFTYIVLVITSPFFFKILKNRSSYILLIAALLFYVPAFYFRIYKPNIFDSGFLNYLQKQIALFGTSFLPFIVGATTLKEHWNSHLYKYIHKLRYKNVLLLSGIVLLIAIHRIVPNCIIAPFMAIPFIFIFVQMDLPKWLNRFLDFFAPHATNLWLIHMFFYITFFRDFIYSPKYVLLIFGLLIICCLASSSIVNLIYKSFLKLLKL